MVLSSHFEGGPAVLSEAVLSDVPIIAHEITATRGLLGAEQDPSFLKLLSDRGDGLKEYFAESTESKAIEKLVTTLGRSF